MNSVFKIFKFVLLDNLRSIWAFAYLLFLAISTFSLIYFTGSFNRSVVSIMNIILLIAPLISTMMTSMYYFNKTDFVQLILAQPISRISAFIGIYLGLAITLSLAVILGLSIGMVVSFQKIDDISLLVTLIVSAVFLSLIFSALAMFISIASKDKLKGIGLAIFIWLFMAVIYDGLLLMYFLLFSEYPIEEHAIVLSLLNPIDLSRISIMLQLDISALMGYSGAIFQKFFGTFQGVLISIFTLCLWVVIPIIGFTRIANKKDY